MISAIGESTPDTLWEMNIIHIVDWVLLILPHNYSALYSTILQYVIILFYIAFLSPTPICNNLHRCVSNQDCSIGVFWVFGTQFPICCTFKLMKMDIPCWSIRIIITQLGWSREFQFNLRVSQWRLFVCVLSRYTLKM